MIEETQPHNPVTWSQVERDGVTILEVHGDIDLSTVPHLRGPLTQRMADRPFILDLQDVPFMDSAGLALIVEARNGFTNRAAFSVTVREQSQPARILRLGQFDRFMHIASIETGPSTEDVV